MIKNVLSLNLLSVLLLHTIILNKTLAQSVTKHGESTSTSSNFVNKNGQIGNAGVLSKYGKIQAIATLTTTSASAITSTTASSGGDVTSDGGASVTARGVCWSTSPGPIIALSTKTSDGTGTGTFTSSITGLSAVTTYYVRAYATNSVGTAYGNEESFTSAWACGSPITINHVASGGVAPVDKSATYGTVTLSLSSSSKCWITRNLGASQEASTPTDNTEASAGWYWQFNRKQGYKHDGTTRTPATAWITSIDENSDWLPANDPCSIELGSGWRIPTNAEWAQLDSEGAWNNYNFAFYSPLKLHTAGDIEYLTGSLGYRGSWGSYWSSVRYDNSYGYSLDFSSGTCSVVSSIKAYGASIRCIKD